MPTYEYRCPDGHEFEQFVQKISQASAALPCPVCGKPAVRRISAGGGFVFKGSGFYITDYGKDGKKDQRDRAEKQKAEVAKAGQQKTETAKAETSAKSESAGKSDSAGKGDRAGKGDSTGKSDSAAKGDAAKVASPPPKPGGKE